ncbi:MAG: hypothetical protein ACTSRZ_08025 [Promethearchaeota archaeon]
MRRRTKLFTIIFCMIFGVSMFSILGKSWGYCPKIEIKTISYTGSVEYGNNLTLYIQVSNKGYNEEENLLIVYPNIFGADLIFDRDNATFNIHGKSITEIIVYLYINVSAGDYELMFSIMRNGKLVTYKIYHLLVEQKADCEPGIYNMTIYNEILVNITIQNFVNNIINNNITIYQDMFNEIFNYFNNTIYNNINNTVYNELYNDIYNQINNSFYADVYNLIENNINNINNINNTLLEELYNYIYNQVNISLQNTIVMPDNGLKAPQIVAIVAGGICFAVGAYGIIMGNPILIENRNNKENDRKKNKSRKSYKSKSKFEKIIEKLEFKMQKQLNYRFKIGFAFLVSSIVFYLFSIPIYDLINPFGNLEQEFYRYLYGFIWTFLIVSIIFAIDSITWRFIAINTFNVMIFVSSPYVGIFFVITMVLVQVIFIIHKKGLSLNIKKEEKINSYYRI